MSRHFLKRLIAAENRIAYAERTGAECVVIADRLIAAMLEMDVRSSGTASAETVVDRDVFVNQLRLMRELPPIASMVANA